MEDLGVTASVSMSTENVERAFDRVGDKAAQMANKVAKEAEKAGAATDNMGAGAEKSAEKFTRAESRMRTAIQKSTRELEMLGKTASQKFEAQLEFKGLDKAKFQPFLDELRKAEEATKKAESGLSGLGSAAQAAGRAMAVAFSGAAAFGVVGKLVEVQREFDVLNSSLKTVTGSSAAAEREMAWLKDFAKETPFGLAQATQGFVKMKALGLDPTRAALTSFGNTASAMGKDLNQMIEAVADASTGEFERLKEFGIKAKKEGDNVSLTFQGVTTTIKNSASEITKYLEDIGNVQFGGAMAERAKTLDGAISELGDTWDELFRTINERNAGTLIYDSIKLANGAIEDATTILRAMGGAAQDAGRDTGALSTIQSGIATVFETVAVLGANLKYVLVQIGNEIGGLAAQVAQAAQFNFSGVAAIRQAMVADAEAARKEIDATTERILRARKAQEEYARYATRNASAATDPRRVDLGGSAPRATTTSASSGAGRGVKEAISEYDKLIKKLSDELPKAAAEAEAAQMGYNKAQTEFLALAGSDVWAKFSNSERARVASLYEGKIASEQAGEAAKELSRAYSEAAAERIKTIQSMERAADSLQSQNDALREEIELIGLSTEQQTLVLQQRNDVIILTKEATLAELERQSAITGTQTRVEIALASEIAALKERNALLGAKGVKNAAVDAAKTAKDEWQKTTDSINNSLTDALMRGFESGKDFAKNLRDTVVNMFKTMVLRPTISAILAPVAGGVTGLLGLSGAANAGQGAGSLMGMASNASSAYNLVSGGLNVASQAGTWLSGKGTELALQYMGESAGTLLNNFALGMSSTSSMSAASAALQGVGADIAGLAVGSVLNGFSGYGISSALSGGYSAGGWVNTVAGIASAIPGVGPIAGVVGGVVNRAFGRKHTQTNLQGTFGGTTGFEGQWEDYYKGGWFRSSKSVYSPLDEETRGALAGQFNAMRVATAAMADVLGLGTDAISNFTASVNIKLKGLSAEDAQKAIQAEFDKIAETLASAALGSEAFSKAGESSVETLTRLSGSLTTVNSAFKLLDIEAWSEQFTASLTGGKNASDYLDKFGGAEVFSQLTASYYDAFYSEAEKTANVTKSITETLASVGLAMPTTREAFRDLTNEYLAMGIYGADTAVALLSVSGAFASITPAAEDAATALETVDEALARLRAGVERTAEDIARSILDLERETSSLQIDLLRAQGNTAGADAANRALDIAGYTEAEIALYDYNAALRAQISGLEAASAAADDARQRAMDEVDSAYTALQRSVDAQRSLVQESINDTRAVFETLRSNVRSLYGEVDSTSAMQAGQGRDYITQALASARATGYLPDNQDLQEAIDAVRRDMQSRVYASQAESDYERLVLAAELKDLQDLSGDQLTEAEKQLKALDDILDNARAQVDALKGINTSVMSVVDAIANLANALTMAKAIGAGAGGAGGAMGPGGKPVGEYLAQVTPDMLKGYTQDQIRGTNDRVFNATWDIKQAWQSGDYAAVADLVNRSGMSQAGIKNTFGLSDANLAYVNSLGIMGVDPTQAAAGHDIVLSGGTATNTAQSALFNALAQQGKAALAAGNEAGIYAEAAARGLDSGDVDALLGLPAGSAEEWARKAGLPVLRVGTNYVPADGLAYLHEGEAIVPKAYNPSAGGMQSNGKLESLVEALTAEVKRLQAIVNDGNREQRRTANAVNGNPDMPMLVQTV